MTDINLNFTDIGTGWLPAERCFTWCKSQHIAYIFHNEWIIFVAGALLVALCLSRLKLYYKHKKDVESAIILAIMMLIIVYIILFLMMLNTIKIGA
jgi:hypothetical protein